MASDCIKVYKNREGRRRFWTIHCPGCAGFDYERDVKKAAIFFAKNHAGLHDGKYSVVVS